MPRRDDDTFGLGYTFTEVSYELTKGPILPSLRPEQAVEIYYNIEITPWMSLTPDIQLIVNPAGATASGNAAGENFSLVLGTRLQMQF